MSTPYLLLIVLKLRLTLVSVVLYLSLGLFFCLLQSPCFPWISVKQKSSKCRYFWGPTHEFKLLYSNTIDWYHKDRNFTCTSLACLRGQPSTRGILHKMNWTKSCFSQQKIPIISIGLSNNDLGPDMILETQLNRSWETVQFNSLVRGEIFGTRVSEARSAMLWRVMWVYLPLQHRRRAW